MGKNYNFVTHEKWAKKILKKNLETWFVTGFKLKILQILEVIEEILRWKPGNFYGLLTWVDIIAGSLKE